MLKILGKWCFNHRIKTVLIWIVCILMLGVGSGAAGNAYDSSFSIPDSQSKEGFDILQDHFPNSTSLISGNIVIKSDKSLDDPAIKTKIIGFLDKVDKLKAGKSTLSVTSFYSPQGANQLSNSKKIGYANVDFGKLTDSLELVAIKEKVEKEIPTIDGVKIYLGGDAFAEFAPPESELIGLSFAILVLIISFGSVLAMGLPISVAVTGVGAGAAATTLLTHLFSVPDFATTMGAMIGLGVGIDYALFIVTRYREGLAKGHSPEKATLIAMDTAGRAVIFAGITVVISLLGMMLMGLAFISGLGIAASITVLLTMISSVTLLPALLGFAQHKVNITKIRGLLAATFVSLTFLSLGLKLPGKVILAPLVLAVSVLVLGTFVKILKKPLRQRKQKEIRDTKAYAWSRLIQRKPLISLILSAALLLLLASPVLSLRLGFSDNGNFPKKSDTKIAYDILTEAFGPGFNGPFLFVSEIKSPNDVKQINNLQKELKTYDGIEELKPAIFNNFNPANPQTFDPTKADAVILNVLPTTGPQDVATDNLVKKIRSELIAEQYPNVKLTGAVPANIDFTSFMVKRMFLFFAVVLSLSFLLLMAVFRSILVPVKAVIVNILSIGAAYGIIVAVFQWGWFHSIFGIGEGGAPIEPFLPMMIFAIVFGLSMDYEVFLLSRIKEEYDRTKDAVTSVADGLAATAKVITAAAAIMVVVFGSFILEDNRIIKIFGLGLATAVLIDATIVRMLLVPATMELLGEKNWWFPKFLDKIIPVLHVEGSEEGYEDDVKSEPSDNPIVN
jgi:RND superfamily putative drug exporter